MLRVNKISVCSDATVTVNNVSINLDPREAIGIVGPNGAGKTTVAQAVAGLRRISGGTITLDVAGRTERLDRKPSWAIPRLGLQYVPAERPIFEVLTVRDHLHFPSTVAPVDRVIVRRSFEDALDLFPLLRTRLDQLAGTLSGGEKRVLALATAYVSSLQRASAAGNAAVLILDEPTHGLAPIAIEGVASAIASLREHGIALVIVEQNIDFARRTADRGYLMSGGRIVWSGQMQEFPHDRDALIETGHSCQRS